jgi:NNP family nitrate/nitrite transporter-like MFS transporter
MFLTCVYLFLLLLCISIVPYVNPPVTGSISGIIGAGGNTGAVLFGLFFRQLSAQTSFVYMGSTIVFSSILSIFIFIKGEPGLIWRTTPYEQPEAAINADSIAICDDKAESQDVNTSVSVVTSSSYSGSVTTGSE